MSIRRSLVPFAFVLAFAGAPDPAPAQPCGDVTSVPLIAGRSIDAGRVSVWNDEDTLFVRIETADGWLLEETAVHVGTSIADIPSTRDGIPIPGRFDHRREHDGEIGTLYEIPLDWPEGTELVLAVHASVSRPGGGGGGRGRGAEETAWAGDEPGPGPRWWFLIRHVVQPCDEPDDEDPEPPGGDGGTGCTPGYWRNHPDTWSVTGLDPRDRVSSLFSSTSGTPEGDRRLIDALPIEGGSTLSGAVRILVRHAVAAVLNSAHPDVDYALTVGRIVDLVNAAVASGSRDRILELKDRLDRYDNSGCRLGNSPRAGGEARDSSRAEDSGTIEREREERRRQAERAREREKRDAEKAKEREKREAEKAREQEKRDAEKAKEREKREAEKARERRGGR